MSGYTVTIAPSDGLSGPRTVITVDTASGAPVVRELTVQADGAGLNAADLPPIDLPGLVAALSASSAGPAQATSLPGSTAAGAARGPRRSASGTRKTAKKTPSSATAAKQPTRGRRRAADDAPATTTTKREYRRMPDQDEVLAAWNDTRSAGRLADHFGVPRHTANGWLRRLRQAGVIDSDA